MNDLELAEELVLGAARLAGNMRLQGLSPEYKTSSADLVTAADRAAEQFIEHRLREERPHDGLTGEEGSSSESRSGRRWYADPIDGTFNFISDLEPWCSAVALDHDGELQVGAVHRPGTGETWVAGICSGTRLNGRRLPTLASRPLGECSVATFLDSSAVGDPALMAGVTTVLGGAATLRISGSGTCDLADVASGRLGLWMQSDCAVWDWLPGRALVEGVGGITAIVGVHGHRWHLAGAETAVLQAAALLSGT